MLPDFLALVRTGFSGLAVKHGRREIRALDTPVRMRVLCSDDRTAIRIYLDVRDG